jgi:hypothetical protein
MLRLYLYARVRVPCAQLHTRPRVQRAPGLPCALFSPRGQGQEQTSGTMRREIAKSYPLLVTRLVHNCALERVTQYSRDASD